MIIVIYWNSHTQKGQIENIQSKGSANYYVTSYSHEYADFGRIAVYNWFRSGSFVESEYYTYNNLRSIYEIRYYKDSTLKTFKIYDIYAVD
jgi:hypothetical protein